MNKEQQELIDEAYLDYLEYTVLGVTNGLDRIAGHLDNCLVEYDGYYEHFTNPSFSYGFRPHTPEEFINKCKTDPEFSERWGLKIGERELSLLVRREIGKDKLGQMEWADVIKLAHYKETYDKYKIPTRLITITYKENKIESYE